MKPCDLCGGNSIDPVALACEAAQQIHADKCECGPARCRRCVDMPKLPCRYLAHGCDLMGRDDGTDWCFVHFMSSDQGFKPDPDSIMRWCFTHNYPISSSDNYIDQTCAELSNGVPVYPACVDRGWVELFARLEVSP